MRLLPLLPLAIGLTAIGLAVTPVHAQEVLQALDSPNAEEDGAFAFAVSAVPDADGDGVSDLLVGAFLEDPGTSPEDAGRAYLFSGATGMLLHELASPNEQVLGSFGVAVSGVSDLDGDGRGDLLVGAHGEEDLMGHDGVVYVFSGATSTLLYELRSPNGEQFAGFGGAVSGVPDADGDGVADVLVGDRYVGVGGKAYLFSGATGVPLHTLISPNEERYGEFGVSVSGVPDADDDGRGDLLIGAWQEDPAGSPISSGRAYLFSGGTGALLHELASTDPAHDGYFGYSVSGVEDVDGDGRGDLLVGAYGEESGGRAYAFSGATGELLHVLASLGPDENELFGWSVSGVEDVDGDGRGDLLVGAWNEYDPPSEVSGDVHVFSGASGAFLYTVTSPSPDPSVSGDFGLAVAGVPDTNGDGRGDLLVGSNEDGSTDDAGRAYLLSGAVLDLEIERLNPVLIPPSGGTFTYVVTTTNTTTETETFELWTRVTTPGGQQTRALLGPIRRTLAPGESVTNEFTQTVPGGIAAGTYTYTASIGRYPREVAVSDAFTFTKEAAVAGREAGSDAALWQEVAESPAQARVSGEVLEAFALHAAHPNPFSSRTALSFDLLEPSHVRLSVYDVLGREVAVLVEGMREAGRHGVTLDGSRLPKGTYLVRLSAGSTVQTLRVTALR